MTKKELETLRQAKEDLILRGTIEVNIDNVYILQINGHTWHEIFHTEESKKKRI